MGIEAATYIPDLTPTTPGTSDLRSQGDDHLRLLKLVLQNTFPTSSKAWYNPTSAAKSADFTVVAADMNKTFIVDTSGGIVNLTLPTLAAGDAGWECFFIKTTAGINPVLVKPASGTLTSGAISGLSAARRSIPGARIRCWWSGSAWFVSRAEGVGGPVGTALEYHGSTLPYGFEWPNGQTLGSAATNYPEYNAVKGSGATFDKRGRLTYCLDNLGGAAVNRITSALGGIDGTNIGNAGGTQNIAIQQANLPPLTPTVSSYNLTVQIRAQGTNGTGNLTDPALGGNNTGQFTLSDVYNVGGTITFNNIGGSSLAMPTLPPGIVLPQILIVE